MIFRSPFFVMAKKGFLLRWGGVLKTIMAKKPPFFTFWGLSCLDYGEKCAFFTF